MSNLPAGTVTFLFTDIEGSTELLKQLGDEYAKLLAEQRVILREAFSRWEGQEVDTQGDSFFYSFPRATQAVNAAVEAQEELQKHDWPQGVSAGVRMGVHTGEPLSEEEGYVGMDVHRAARIAAAGHGGQILLSETTEPLIRDSLPEGVSMIDLGRHRLKDMRRPERITQLGLEGFQSNFPPLNSLEVLSNETAFAADVIQPAAYLDLEVPDPIPAFVGRQSQMHRLNEIFEGVLEGEGQIVFVTGGAGRGKTALLESFSRNISESHPETMIAWGECSAFSGRGDPLLPFRQVLKVLTGDIKNQWMAGRICTENARNVWGMLPLAARTIVNQSPGLITNLISGLELIARLRAVLPASTPWLERLSQLADRIEYRARKADPNVLFEEYEGFLTELGVEVPIVVVLDDVQWIDSASADLLFHLSRNLSGKRILLVGAYRPEEIRIDRIGGRRHPLQDILHELKRYFGEHSVDLSRISDADNRDFIDLLVDTERNQLDQTFRSSLYKHTEGHPLFTVELLRSMQERGVLNREDGGDWVQIGQPDWENLPARVEGVIEERIERVDPTLRKMLDVASVEGEQFSVQVLMQVLDLDKREVTEALNQDLERRYRLVRELGSEDASIVPVSRFRFQHVLYHRYLYKSLGNAARRAHHAAIGHALENIYADDSKLIAPQLARHFSLGGIHAKALRYLNDAGDQARMTHAFDEAISFYEDGLDLLERRGEPEIAARILMKMGLIFASQGENERANEMYEQAFELWKPVRTSWERERKDRVTETLRIAVAAPQTLDPGFISDDSSLFIANQLFEGLVTLDEENNVLPAVASHWEILDGGKRYRFHLREGLTWSDGTPLSADDFVNAWRRNLLLAERSHVAHLLYVVSNARAFAVGGEHSDVELGVHAEGPLTLEVELETTIAYLPHLLTHPVTFPLPSNLESETIANWFNVPSRVTNGPYILGGVNDEHFILERNPHYRGSFPGNIQQVECVLMDDYSTVFDRYDRGELEVISMITSDPGTVRHAGRRYGDELHFVTQPSTFFVAFCNECEPFNHVDVRKAFVHAVDREALVRETSHGQYKPAHGGFLPPGMPGHQPHIGLKFDPETAKEFLANAGFRNGNRFPSVELLFTGPDEQDPVIDFLCRIWQTTLGVEISAKNVTWAEFVRRRDQDPPDISIMGYSADYPDPDAVLRVLFHSQEGFNPIRWNDERFDRLIDEASTLMDADKRMRLYRQADRILVREQAGVMLLGYVQSRQLVKPYVQMDEVPSGQMQIKTIVRKKEVE